MRKRNEAPGRRCARRPGYFSAKPGRLCLGGSIVCDEEKILSLLLAVSLLLSLCSPAAMAASSVTIVIDLTNYAGEVSGKLIGKPIEAQKRNEIVISGTGYVLATTISLGEDITCSWNVEGLDSGYLTYDENSHLSAIKLSPSGTKNVITVVDSKLEVTRTSREYSDGLQRMERRDRCTYACFLKRGSTPPP